jgi:hypothetical protein
VAETIDKKRLLRPLLTDGSSTLRKRFNTSSGFIETMMPEVDPPVPVTPLQAVLIGHRPQNRTTTELTVAVNATIVAVDAALLHGNWT